jgi:hypothetical protein
LYDGKKFEKEDKHIHHDWSRISTGIVSEVMILQVPYQIWKDMMNAQSLQGRLGLMEFIMNKENKISMMSLFDTVEGRISK